MLVALSVSLIIFVDFQIIDIHALETYADCSEIYLKSKKV